MTILKNKILLATFGTVILLIVVGGGWYMLKGREGAPKHEEVMIDLSQPPIFEEITIENLPKGIDELAWTADGKRVITLSVVGGEPQKVSIGIIDLEGRTYRELYSAEDAYLSDLSWDQDRKVLFFFERNFEKQRGQSEEAEKLRLLSVEDGVIKTVKSAERLYGPKKLSPDGRYIAYGLDSDTRIITTDGKELKDLSNIISDSALQIQWMPDSSSLAYLAAGVKTSGEQSTYEIRRIDIFTEEDTRLLSGIKADWRNEPIFTVDSTGEKILFVAQSLTAQPEETIGRHLWLHDLKSQTTKPLSQIKGENIERFTWTEDGSGAIALRHRVIEGDRHIVVFPSFSEEKARVFPLNDDFIPIDDPLSWEANSLWLSNQSEEMRFLRLDLEDLGYKFTIAQVGNLFPQDKFFSQYNLERQKVVTYKNEEIGITFDYPASWGRIIEETDKNYSCFRPSQLEGVGQLRITTVNGIEDYLNSLRGKSEKELNDSLEKWAEESELGRNACLLGPVGYIGLLGSEGSSEIGFGFRGILYDLDYLALLEPEGVNTKELMGTAISLASLFSDGLMNLDGESIQVLGNNNGSLVGLTFSINEGWDTGSTTYLETIYTRPTDNTAIVLLKIPIPESLSSEFGYDQGKQIVEILKNNLIQEKGIVEKSIQLSKNGETVQLSAEEKNVLRQDLKKKTDLYVLAGALGSYRKGEGGYPITQGMERLTTKTLGSSKLYRAFQEARYHFPSDYSPWDFELPEGEYFGYISDGSYYELIAVLGNRSDGECVVEGGFCIYRIRNGDVTSKR